MFKYRSCLLTLAFLALLSACGAARGQDCDLHRKGTAGRVADACELSLPERVEGKPGRYIGIKPEGCPADAVIRWIYPEHCELTPFSLKDPSMLVFLTEYRGTFRVGAYTAYLDADGRPVPSQIVWATVSTGDPPAPTPEPDAFARELRRLYDADPGPGKAGQVRDLAAAYRAMAGAVAGHGTAGSLYDELVRRTRASVPAGALDAIRRRVATEAAGTLPGDPKTELTPSLKDAAAELFGRVADALDYAGGRP